MVNREVREEMIVRKVTQNCIDIIKHYEGFSSKPYVCPAGYLTIGIGHLILPNEKFDEVTVEEGENILRKDLIKSEKSVLRCIKVPLEDHQFDALVSFTFNLGGGALQCSTLRQKINREEHEDVPDEFRRWVFAGGRELKGLVKRRETEAILYSTSDVVL